MKNGWWDGRLVAVITAQCGKPQRLQANGANRGGTTLSKKRNSADSTATRMKTAKQLIESFDSICAVRVSGVYPQLTTSVPVARCRQIAEPLCSHGANDRMQAGAGHDPTGANLRLVHDTTVSRRSSRCDEGSINCWNDDDENENMPIF